MDIKDLLAQFDDMEAEDGMNIVEETNATTSKGKISEGATNGPTYDNIIAEYSKYIPQRTNAGEQTAETCKIAIALLDDIWRTIQDDEDSKDIANTILECIDGISNFVPELQ